MHVIEQERELFQQDNARPHTARVAIDYLEQKNINVLPWLSKSPDFNPIEHLDKRVRQRQPPPGSDPRSTPPNVAAGIANNT